jgi:hypothetical protein
VETWFSDGALATWQATAGDGVDGWEARRWRPGAATAGDGSLSEARSRRDGVGGSRCVVEGGGEVATRSSEGGGRLPR